LRLQLYTAAAALKNQELEASTAGSNECDLNLCFWSMGRCVTSEDLAIFSAGHSPLSLGVLPGSFAQCNLCRAQLQLKTDADDEEAEPMCPAVSCAKRPDCEAKRVVWQSVFPRFPLPLARHRERIRPLGFGAGETIQPVGVGRGCQGYAARRSTSRWRAVGTAWLSGYGAGGG